MLRLESIDFFRDTDDGVFPGFEMRRQCRHNVCLLLEDKSREKGYNFFGLEFCQSVFEYKFSEY